MCQSISIYSPWFGLVLSYHSACLVDSSSFIMFYWLASFYSSVFSPFWLGYWLSSLSIIVLPSSSLLTYLLTSLLSLLSFHSLPSLSLYSLCSWLVRVLSALLCTRPARVCVLPFYFSLLHTLTPFVFVFVFVFALSGPSTV